METINEIKEKLKNANTISQILMWIYVIGFAGLVAYNAKLLDDTLNYILYFISLLAQVVAFCGGIFNTKSALSKTYNNIEHVASDLDVKDTQVQVLSDKVTKYENTKSEEPNPDLTTKLKYINTQLKDIEKDLINTLKEKGITAENVKAELTASTKQFEKLTSELEKCNAKKSTKSKKVTTKSTSKKDSNDTTVNSDVKPRRGRPRKTDTVNKTNTESNESK